MLHSTVCAKASLLLSYQKKAWLTHFCYDTDYKTICEDKSIVSVIAKEGLGGLALVLEYYNNKDVKASLNVTGLLCSLME